MHRTLVVVLLPAVAATGLAALLGLATAGCGADAPRPSDHVTREIVRDYVEERGGEMAYEDPLSEEVVVLTLDAVHDAVRTTEGGRQVVCVDFRSEDGTVYDLDHYVGGERGLEVQDVVMHRVGDETVLSPEERARLDERGPGA